MTVFSLGRGDCMGGSTFEILSTKYEMSFLNSMPLRDTTRPWIYQTVVYLLTRKSTTDDYVKHNKTYYAFSLQPRNVGLTILSLPSNDPTTQVKIISFIVSNKMKKRAKALKQVYGVYGWGYILI